jgi:hypothetical protein
MHSFADPSSWSRAFVFPLVGQLAEYGDIWEIMKPRTHRREAILSKNVKKRQKISTATIFCQNDL